MRPAHPLLLVMNPRCISRCVQAIADLPIDKMWLSFMWESELEDVIAMVVERTPYTHFIVLSDDCVPTILALEKIVGALGEHGDACVTGYCNNFVGSPHVNVTRRPLGPKPLDPIEWCTREEIANGEPTFRSYFTGMAFTAMSRALWIRFPFRTIQSSDVRGYCSDWLLSKRLNDEGVPIVGIRDAFVEHLKEEGGRGVADKDPEKRLLVTVLAPEVRWQRRDGTDRLAIMRPWTLDPLRALLG